ncbi:CRAL-TRIO domain-containing protein [Coniochaeta sp. 2T2.1]|nr:CRAL-TRIO domain-containing protein [Coniochaeta sp. 2T2.1]
MSAVESTTPAAAPPAAAAAPTETSADPTKDVAVADPEANKTQAPLLAPGAPEASEVSKDHEVKEAPAPKEAEKPAAPTLSPIAQLWAAAKSHGHPEIWGVTLADPEAHVPTRIVLQKYLNANDGDVSRAKEQLTKTLDWRAKMKPLELVEKAFDKSKFGGLGYVTSYSADEASTDPEVKEVFTWNIYGSVKSIDATFGNLEEFIQWRVALMELALRSLSLSTATVPIPADGSQDPYKIYQVHDYKSISFLRSPANVRTASSETIRVFAQNYPELLKEKFFVNVPAFMGFVYAFMKRFVAAKTIRKFHPMSNGANLAREFVVEGKSKVQELAGRLPVEYGGEGGELGVQGKETLLGE